MNTLDYRNQNFQFNVYPRSLARFVGLGQRYETITLPIL